MFKGEWVFDFHPVGHIPKVVSERGQVMATYFK